MDIHCQIPRYIDDPEQLFLWEMDEAGLVAVIFCLGMLAHHLILAIPLCLLAGYLYGKFKKGKPRGFLLHFLYFHGIIELKKLPPSYIKEFLE